MVRSVVDYALQLEVLAESDTFAIQNVMSTYSFSSTNPAWSDPGLNSTKGYMTAIEDQVERDWPENLHHWQIEFPSYMVYEVKELILKKVDDKKYQDIVLERFKVRYWINSTIGWKWYPTTTDKMTEHWDYTGMTKEQNSNTDTIIKFDSFDARKVEIYYQVLPENNNMMAMRFDLLISRAKRYFWRDIALVIRNVPTSPYVIESEPIFLLITNQTKEEE